MRNNIIYNHFKLRDIKLHILCTKRSATTVIVDFHELVVRVVLMLPLIKKEKDKKKHAVTLRISQRNETHAAYLRK